MPPSLISIIVPVYNGGATLQACLAALNGARDTATEILVIDDNSTDNSAVIASKLGAKVIANSRARGPAGARNEGAQHAKGAFLFFVDADVVVPQSTVTQVRRLFDAHPEISAVFGSYDLAPGSANFLSQYKNLFHHYVHQRSREDSASFWAGCGAIRTDVFRKLGGFNEKVYPHPSIEDIELGWRMNRSGHRTRLEKNLQVKHLKKWTVWSLLKADIFRRAVPWTRLMANTGDVPNDLNVQTSQRISGLLACIAAVCVPLAFFVPWMAPLTVIGSAGVVLLNLDFYRFFHRNRGLWFTCGVFFWHILYFLYSSVTFALCWPYYWLAKHVMRRH